MRKEPPMRDPELMFRAQVAASALERAWEQWRAVHGQAAEPMPTISSYVGYSLDEPWGEPRVVFGLAAEDAEQLAILLERHDCVGPVHAMVRRPGMREAQGELGLPGSVPAEPLLPLPIPAQPPAPAAEYRARMWQPPRRDEGAVPDAAEDTNADGDRLPAFQDAPWARPRFLDDEPVGPGPLELAASNARFEAEARIKAAVRGRGRSTRLDDLVDLGGPAGKQPPAAEQQPPAREQSPAGEQQPEGEQRDLNGHAGTIGRIAPSPNSGRNGSEQRTAKPKQPPGEVERRRGPFVPVEKTDQAVRTPRKPQQGSDQPEQLSDQANEQPAESARSAERSGQPEPDEPGQPEHPGQAKPSDQPEEPDAPGEFDQSDELEESGLPGEFEESDQSGQRSGPRAQGSPRRGRIARTSTSRPAKTKHSGVASGS
jgi:hypothetical protein